MVLTMCIHLLKLEWEKYFKMCIKNESSSLINAWTIAREWDILGHVAKLSVVHTLMREKS